MTLICWLLEVLRTWIWTWIMRIVWHCSCALIVEKHGWTCDDYNVYVFAEKGYKSKVICRMYLWCQDLCQSVLLCRGHLRQMFVKSRSLLVKGWSCWIDAFLRLCVTYVLIFFGALLRIIDLLDIEIDIIDSFDCWTLWELELNLVNHVLQHD